MFLFNIRKHLFLIIFYFIIFSSSINSLLSNDQNVNNNIEDEISLIEEHSNIKEKYNFLRQLLYLCATNSLSKSEIKEECSNGPSSYERILKYKTFSSYISNHDYYSNGLNYVTSLFVDSETHNFGNFMNEGAGIIILYIINGFMLLGWIPIFICWRYRCCIFDDCLYSNNCCVIFWHILTYFLALLVFIFLIVVLCFAR